MEEVLSLSQAELDAIAALASGAKTHAQAIADDSLAPLVQRNLVSTDGGKVAFSDTLQSAFRPMATAKANVVVMNDAGVPVEQFFIGEGDATSHVTPGADGMAIELLKLDGLPAAVAANVTKVLAGSTEGEMPDAEGFQAACATLELEGMKPLAWGAVVITRSGFNTEQAPVNEWVGVVRCDQGYVMQDNVRGTLVFADTVEDLSEAIGGALAGG